MANEEQNEIREELQDIADELRAIGQTGLFYARRDEDEYDIARYERVLALAARVLGLTDTRTADEILKIYNGDINPQTPKVAAFGALFDAQGRILLMQRADNRHWAMPGGMVEVGETAAQAAEREFWEETGVRVRAERLIGIYDNRAYGGRAPFQTYMVGFICSYASGTPHPTSEALDVGYFTEDDLPPLTPGARDRVPQAFAWHRGERTGPHFEREVEPG
ncbi:MAG: NUDIX hydrolase N-terminal domain-containing protein [Chloroflexota bacterium]|nr:NUDIX hydrolase N-terminal domain-containing protein [Chloroflexota bacterium]MDE2930875.1 NUDIX hydrolase N-terminal domain-containing protein [Chloroflexota bacterium]